MSLPSHSGIYSIVIHVPGEVTGVISALRCQFCIYKSNITGNVVHTTGPTYEGVQLPVCVVVDYYVAR